MNVEYPDGEYIVQVTPTQVASLPSSRSGLGLDRVRADLEEAVSHLSYEQLQAALETFCSGYSNDDADDDSDMDTCECRAVITGCEQADVTRYHEHMAAEMHGRERLYCLWYARHHPDVQVWVSGTPGPTVLERLAEFG